MDRENAPAQQIATLTIHQAKSDTPDAQARSETVDRIAFNPWNTTDEFRPLGSLNRARKQVYDASAAHREQMRWHTEIPVRNVIVGTIARRLYSLVNRYREWHQLPAHLALLNLDVLRGILREHNLIDTEPREVPPRARTVPPEPPQESRSARTPDGSHNDLSAPKMGAVGSRFGRNLAADYQEKLFNTPNPIEVSEVLLKRDHFLPARSLNMIAAAWIQFQVHDWVKHRQYKLGEHDIEIAVPDGVPWANSRGGPIETTMRIAGDETVDARTRRNEPEPSFKNVVSHWWDGSEVYGSDAATTAGLRQGAKILLTHDGYLPIDRMTGLELTGFTDSSWLGLSALHTLFAREHNVVCDELRAITAAGEMIVSSTQRV